jgi:hypothetical protein
MALTAGEFSAPAVLSSNRRYKEIARYSRRKVLPALNSFVLIRINIP